MRRTHLLKNSVKTSILASLAAFSLNATSELQILEVEGPVTVNTYDLEYSAKPNLVNINDVQLRLQANEYGETMVDRLTVDFRDAKDITAYNFSYDNASGEYFARVRNAWIYKEVIVSIKAGHPSHDPYGGGSNDFNNARITIKVPYVNEVNQNINQGAKIAEFDFNNVKDKTYNRLADYTKVLIDGKWMTIRVYQNYISESAGYGNTVNGFKITTSWYGHGDREQIIFAPKPVNNGKAVAVKLVDSSSSNEDPSFNDKEVVIEYHQDGNNLSQKSEVVKSLQYMIDQLYGPVSGQP